MLVNCFSCDVLHVCQNKNDVGSVFSLSLPAGPHNLPLFLFACYQGKVSLRREGGWLWWCMCSSSSKTAELVCLEQPPFGVGAVLATWTSGFSLFTPAPWAWKERTKEAHGMWLLSYCHSLGSVPLWFMNAWDCWAGNEESLQRDLGVSEGGASQSWQDLEVQRVFSANCALREIVCVLVAFLDLALVRERNNTNPL